MTGRRLGPQWDSQTGEAPADLERVLVAWCADAAQLQRYGHADQAEIILQLCRDVERAAADWLEWLPEKTAMLKSGHSEEWLRARFAQWERAGDARKAGGRRVYRAAVVPQRLA